MSHLSVIGDVFILRLGKTCYGDVMTNNILSIQSSVTLGGVGNTMAAAVMAASRHQLCRLDTIQLTAHPGHGIRAGGSISDEDFAAVLDGITSLNRWPTISGMMTGYMGSIGQVRTTASAFAHFRASCPNGAILVDPAVGDHGRLYVDADMANAIASSMISAADIITPNRFELSYFSGMDCDDLDGVLKAAHHLLNLYPNLTGIAVTGIAVTGISSVGQIADCWITSDSHIVHQGAEIVQNEGGMPGGGDLFAAILMMEKMDGLNWQDSTAIASKLSQEILASMDKAKQHDISLRQVTETLKARA